MKECWQANLETYKGIKSTFIIEGNINDRYAFTDEAGAVSFSPLQKTIEKIFQQGRTQNTYQFLTADPINGFSNPLGNPEAQTLIARGEAQAAAATSERATLNKNKKAPPYSDNQMIHVSNVIRALMTQADDANAESKPIVLIVNCTAQYLSGPDGLSVDERTFFLNLSYASQHAIRVNNNCNTLVLVLEKQSDLPNWFCEQNKSLQVLHIETPNRVSREQFITSRYPVFAQGAANTEAMKQKFINLTNGLTINQLDEMRRLVQRDQLTQDKILSAVTLYKYGYRENPWALMRSHLQHADFSQLLTRRVKGQPVALDKVSLVLKRALCGLSGLQHSAGGEKPRGVLFLAGPTGSGKTETAKAVAELVFGDERALVRFDMSEYAHEAADQKLLGSPPGYVGHSEGGQLTNAIKNNPCCVLLFDEIEKAHPKILEKFLQALDDGRMTDGRGETVSFAQTLIFFTSNIGISQEVVEHGQVVKRVNMVQPGQPYADICENVSQAMETYFKPEVLNRIGENVVVFDFISAEAVQLILEAKLDQINENIQNSHGVSIHMAPGVQKVLFAHCWTPHHRAHGGRGVGNVIEAHYINPLGEALFAKAPETSSILQADVMGEKIVFH